MQSRRRKVYEERITSLQVAKDELQRCAEAQSKEIEELHKYREAMKRDFESDLKKERQERLKVEKELLKVQADLEAAKKEHEQFLLVAKQLQEAENKMKGLEEKLEAKEKEIQRMKVEEAKKLGALEAAVSHSVLSTFAEAKRHQLS